MSAVLDPSKLGKPLYQNFSDTGSSKEYKEINNKFKEAEEHQQERLSVIYQYNTLFYLRGSSNLEDLENRVEDVYNLLLDNPSVFTNEEVSTIAERIEALELSELLSIAKLLGPLLENIHYSEAASDITQRLLKNPNPEVRYAALEAISFALGEVEIADKLVAEAKTLLKSETSPFVSEYLESF